MNNRIDRCLGEGLLSPSKYFDLTKVGLDYFAIDPETRFHEAGHAVVGYLQGRRIKHVYAAPFDEINLLAEIPLGPTTMMTLAQEMTNARA